MYTRAILVRALRQPIVPERGTHSVNKVSKSNQVKKIKDDGVCFKTNIPEPTPLQLATCRLRAYSIYLDPWHYVHKLGFQKCKVVKFRRKLKKFHYPWLVYSVPTGVTMGLGDVLAQLYWEKKDKINLCRSFTMGAIGMFIVGPISCKWTLFWYRRLPKFNAPEYLVKTLLLDILILQPLNTMVTMLAYDYKVVKERWRKYDKLWKERYKQPFFDIMKFYAETRPIVAIISCFLLPMAMRKHIRRFYFIFFYSYLSYIIHKAAIGGEHKNKSSNTNQGVCPCLKKYYNKLFGK